MSLPLDFWINLWKIVFIVGVVLFGSMAIWVSIGGFFDIKRLFKTIAEGHEQEEQPSSDQTADQPLIPPGQQ